MNLFSSSSHKHISTYIDFSVVVVVISCLLRHISNISRSADFASGTRSAALIKHCQILRCTLQFVQKAIVEIHFLTVF